MKKILIVNNNMHIGGVQKALVDLLWNIRGQYDITLLLFYKCGEYLNALPPDVKVITANWAYKYLGMSGRDACSLPQKLGRSFFAAITRLFGRKFAIGLMAVGQKTLEGYDAAISYLHNGADKAFYGGCNDFVLKHISAKKKITFLHCDYTLCGANTAKNAQQYKRFDLIAACSQGCADAFKLENSTLAQKVKVVYNCHDFKSIRKMAESAPVSLQADKINIVTVARLGKEKGVERALRVIAGLGKLKEKLHYYVIGDGVLMPVLRRISQEENLNSCVTLCGAQINPYGYMKAADLLLIPSYSEAAPLVIGEAACLGTPILSTETSSAREMIENTGYGWVCENSEKAMQEALQRLLADTSVLDEKKLALTNREFGNEAAVSQFVKLVD